MINHEDMASSSPAWRFRMLQNAHRAAVDASLERCGVREFGQPFILFMLARVSRNGAFDSQRELAEGLRVSPATVTASLKSLEKQGCIVRAAGEGDMRKKRIMITDMGREVTEKCGRAFAAIDEAMYAGFSPDELDRLSDYFTRITENLRRLSSGQEDNC